MNSNETLAFLENLSKQAMETKDVGLLHHIGGNPALSHYLANVYTIKSVSAAWWAENYPQFMVEADRLREKYEADQAAAGYGSRLDTLESKIDKLTAALAPLIEGKTSDAPIKENDAPPPPPADKPKPADKPAPVVEPLPAIVPTQEPDEDDTESPKDEDEES